MATRLAFDQELQRLQDELIFLGKLIENAVANSVDILRRRDTDASRRLIAEDNWINKKRFAIESDILTLIATQQPVAIDMRVLAAMLEIATELERIGDYAKGIANINLMMSNDQLIKPLGDIPRMATKVGDMLHRSLVAFIERDVEAARALPAEDDEVDGLYNQVYRELLTLIMANPQNMDEATYLLWVAHNLERTADRVVNICERTVFAVTGELDELN